MLVPRVGKMKFWVKYAVSGHPGVALHVSSVSERTDSSGAMGLRSTKTM